MARKRILESRFDDGNNSLTVTAYDDKCVYFEIDNPWYGSTESGLGATLQISVRWDKIKPMIKDLFVFMETGEEIS